MAGYSFFEQNRSDNCSVQIWRFGIPIACVVLILVGAGLSWHLFDSPSFFYPSMYDGLAYYVMVSDTSKHPGVSKGNRERRITASKSLILSRISSQICLNETGRLSGQTVAFFSKYAHYFQINNSRNGLITSLVSPAISVTLYTTAICFLRKKWKLKFVFFFMKFLWNDAIFLKNTFQNRPNRIQSPFARISAGVSSTAAICRLITWTLSAEKRFTSDLMPEMRIKMRVFQLYFFVKGKDISDDEALMLFEMLPWLFDLR